MIHCVRFMTHRLYRNQNNLVISEHINGFEEQNDTMTTFQSTERRLTNKESYHQAQCICISYVIRLYR